MAVLRIPVVYIHGCTANTSCLHTWLYCEYQLFTYMAVLRIPVVYIHGCQGLIQRINLGVGRYRGQTRRRRVCPREVSNTRERGTGCPGGRCVPPQWGPFANKRYGDAIRGLLRGTFETTCAKFLRSRY